MKISYITCEYVLKYVYKHKPKPSVRKKNFMARLRKINLVNTCSPFTSILPKQLAAYQVAYE